MWGHPSLLWLAQGPSLHREGNRSNQEPHQGPSKQEPHEGPSDQEPHQGPFMQGAMGWAVLLHWGAGAQGGDMVSRLGLRRARLSQGERLHSSQETGSS